MPVPAPPAAPPDFEEVYDTYFGFVWRSVLNRGIPAWPTHSRRRAGT